MFLQHSTATITLKQLNKLYNLINGLFRIAAKVWVDTFRYNKIETETETGLFAS